MSLRTSARRVVGTVAVIAAAGAVTSPQSYAAPSPAPTAKPGPPKPPIGGAPKGKPAKPRGGAKGSPGTLPPRR